MATPITKSARLQTSVSQPRLRLGPDLLRTRRYVLGSIFTAHYEIHGAKNSIRYAVSYLLTRLRMACSSQENEHLLFSACVPGAEEQVKKKGLLFSVESFVHSFTPSFTHA